MLGLFEINEGDVGTAEELFHVVRVAAGVVGIILDTVFEFDGADRTESAFITEDEIDAFAVDETVSGVTVLDADFVAEEGRKTDFRDDVETLPEEIIEHLEAELGIADHEVLAGAVFETVDGFALAAAGGDADENRYQKQ